MNRIRALNGYQKGVLLVMAAMLLVFSVLYPLITARRGFPYGGTFLTPGQEYGSRVYSGRLRGKELRFAVSGDGTLTLRHGERLYQSFGFRENGELDGDELVAVLAL